MTLSADNHDPGKLLTARSTFASSHVDAWPLQGSTSLHLSARISMPERRRPRGLLSTFPHFIMETTPRPASKRRSYFQIPGVKIPSLKLIAAAPDLLDACHQISSILDLLFDEADLSSKLEDAQVDAIRDDLFQFQDILDRLNA